MAIVLQIYDDDNLLRRVPIFLPNYVKDDGTISSMAFQPIKGGNGLSVDLENLSSFKQATLGNPGFRLLKINAGTIHHSINDGLGAIHDPQPDNYAHSLIIGNISNGKQKQLLKNSIEIFDQ